jgi:hypothetical protein
VLGSAKTIIAGSSSGKHMVTIASTLKGIGRKTVASRLRGNPKDRSTNIGVPDPNGWIVTHTVQDELDAMVGGTTIGGIFYGAFRYGGKSHETAMVGNSLGNIAGSAGSGSRLHKKNIPVPHRTFGDAPPAAYSK